MKNIIPEKEFIFEDPEKFLSWGDKQTGVAVLCDELHESRTGVCFLYSDRTEVGLLSFQDHKKMLEKVLKEKREYKDIIKHWKKRGWKLNDYDYKTEIAKGTVAGDLYFKRKMKEKSPAIKIYMEDGAIVECVKIKEKEHISFEPFSSRDVENENYYKAEGNLIDYLGKSIDEKGLLLKDLIEEIIGNLLKNEPTMVLDSCVMFMRAEDLIPASERGRVGILGYQLYSAFGLKKNKGEEL